MSETALKQNTKMLIQALNRKESKLLRRFQASKSYAKTRGVSWDLTYEEYAELVTQKCFYCKYALNKSGVGLDRIDNAHGYGINNVVSSCWSCNNLRGNRFSQDEVIVMIKALKQHRKQNRNTVAKRRNQCN